MLSEDVFLPVAAQTVPAIPEIVCVAEAHAGVSLVPHGCRSWISVVCESSDTVDPIWLPDSCRYERT